MNATGRGEARKVAGPAAVCRWSVVRIAAASAALPLLPVRRCRRLVGLAGKPVLRAGKNPARIMKEEGKKKDKKCGKKSGINKNHGNTEKKTMYRIRDPHGRPYQNPAEISKFCIFCKNHKKFKQE